MLPLVLDPQYIKAGLIGQGAARDRRAALLAEAGVDAVLLADDAPDAALAPLTVLFVAGLGEGQSRCLAARARALGVLVNVEDILPPPPAGGCRAWRGRCANGWPTISGPNGRSG